jgi:hypothetical protein
MQTYKTPMSIRILGSVSLLLGLLGGAFFWWTPLGMVLSLSGLLTGFIGWTESQRKGVGTALAVAGMLLSVAALILCGVIAGLGLERIRFEALR